MSVEVDHLRDAYEPVRELATEIEALLPELRSNTRRTAREEISGVSSIDPASFAATSSHERLDLLERPLDRRVALAELATAAKADRRESLTASVRSDVRAVFADRLPGAAAAFGVD